MQDSDYLKRSEAQPHLKVMECLRKWDPIGVFQIDGSGPQDEYDGYSPAIVRMLHAGIDADGLTNHLQMIAEKNMGLRCDQKKSRAIAEELVEYLKQRK